MRSFGMKNTDCPLLVTAVISTSILFSFLFPLLCKHSFFYSLSVSWPHFLRFTVHIQLISSHCLQPAAALFIHPLLRHPQPSVWPLPSNIHCLSLFPSWTTPCFLISKSPLLSSFWTPHFARGGFLPGYVNAPLCLYVCENRCEFWEDFG